MSDKFTPDQLEAYNWLSLLEELEATAEQPVRDDVRIGKYAAALGNLVLHHRPVGEFLQLTLHEQTRVKEFDELVKSTALEERQSPDFVDAAQEQLEEQSAYYVRLLFSSVQRQLWSETGDHSYPANPDYTTQKHWEEVLASMLGEDNTYRDNIYRDVTTRELMSNVGQRYITVKLLAETMTERFGDSPRVLDSGCSIMIGDRKLMSEGASRLFQAPRVVKPSHSQHESPHETNHELTEAMMQVAYGEYVGRKNATHVGMDKIEEINADIIDWARSNTFGPAEIIEKPQLIDQFDDITAVQSDNIRFVSHDLSSDIGEKLPERSFDILFFSTVLYQMSGRNRDIAIENAVRLVSPNGLIVIQDGIKDEPQTKKTLRYSAANFRKPYSYGTYIYDMANPNQGFQHLAEWKDGRCTSLYFGNSLIAQEVLHTLARNARG